MAAWGTSDWTSLNPLSIFIPTTSTSQLFDKDKIKPSSSISSSSSISKISASPLPSQDYDYEKQTGSSKDKETTVIKAKDGRLFPRSDLYSEGLPRPKFRGVFHLFAVMLLPFGWWHLFREADGNHTGQIVASVYISSNIFCYGSSAIYHVGRWSKHTEIFLQKLDHCGIAILSTGTQLPSAILLIGGIEGFIFATITISLCLWTCFNIFELRPSILRQVSVALSFVPFLPSIYYHSNSIEWEAVVLGFFFQCLGLMVFVKRKPSLLPAIFGYHEIFHLFVLCSGLFVYILNWSIIRRTCQPYALHTDLREILTHIFDERSIQVITESE